MKKKQIWLLSIVLSITPFILLFIVFLFAPLSWIIVNSFQNEEGTWTLAWFREIFSEQFYLQALILSLKISFWPSLIGIIVGLVGAYSLYQVKNTIFGKLVLALYGMMSNFSGVPLAFAFIIILGTNGVITLLLQSINLSGLIDVYSFSGLLVVYTYFQIPLAILLLYPSIESLKIEWRESAALLGASKYSYFYYIALPILFPAILATFIILFANALGAYATTYALTAGNFNILPIRIASLIAGNFSLEPYLAAAISVILMLIMVTITLLHQLLHRRLAYLS